MVLIQVFDTDFKVTKARSRHDSFTSHGDNCVNSSKILSFSILLFAKWFNIFPRTTQGRFLIAFKWCGIATPMLWLNGNDAKNLLVLLFWTRYELDTFSLMKIGFNPTSRCMLELRNSTENKISLETYVNFEKMTFVLFGNNFLFIVALWFFEEKTKSRRKRSLQKEK